MLFISKMEIAATVSNLIRNLMPNSNGHWVPSKWIDNELSPLLSSMHSKDIATAKLASTNASTNNTYAILLSVVFTILLILSAIMFLCYRHSGQISSRITDGLHHVFGELGTRAPNRIPTFAI